MTSEVVERDPRNRSILDRYSIESMTHSIFRGRASDDPRRKRIGIREVRGKPSRANSASLLAQFVISGSINDDVTSFHYLNSKSNLKFKNSFRKFDS